MFAQCVFQVAGINIESPRNDHVFFAIHQRQKTIFIKPANVSRSNESLSTGIKPLRFARLLRLAMVARHHGQQMPHHLTCFTDGHFYTSVIDEPDVIAGKRLSHGVQLGRQFVRFEHATATALRHAIKFNKATWPASDHICLQAGREWQWYLRPANRLFATRRQRDP